MRGCRFAGPRTRRDRQGVRRVEGGLRSERVIRARIAGVRQTRHRSVQVPAFDRIRQRIAAYGNRETAAIQATPTRARALRWQRVKRYWVDCSASLGNERQTEPKEQAWRYCSPRAGRRREGTPTASQRVVESFLSAVMWDGTRTDASMRTIYSGS